MNNSTIDRSIIHSVNHLPAILLLLSGLLIAPVARALDAENLLLTLPTDLEDHEIAQINTMAVFDVTSGKVRFLPAITDISNVTSDRLKSKGTQGDIVLLKTAFDSNNRTKGLSCDCEYILNDSEYLVSETPVLDQASAGYVSINDEAYKAVMELIDYPLTSLELTTVAFSELSYVNHQDAIEQFLNARDFELIESWGFLNSANYPGFLDTQFFLAKRISDDQYFLVIRGTSGRADVSTSARVGFVRWGKRGKALKGYAEVAEHVWAELRPHLSKIQSSDKPVIVTGHSLGGAISILTAIRFADINLPYTVHSYAPAPIGDPALYDFYQHKMDKHVTNYYLPNEELLATRSAQVTQYVRLIGTTRLLQDVGTTAGAAHFIINYLKSMLLEYGYSREWYEHSMPHCVVVKYPCFAATPQGDFQENLARYVPLCSYTNEDCEKRAALHLRGYQSAGTPEQIMRLAARKKLVLVERKLDLQQQALLFLQLSNIHRKLGDTALAQKFLHSHQNRLAELGISP
jgi:pimeloyl-ACP methyl ester carboxylesterase